MSQPSNDPEKGTSLQSPEGVTSDRRQAPRFTVRLSAEERAGPMQLLWSTTDLSITGLSMRDSFSRPVGTRLRLELHLGDATQPLPVLTEVVGPYGDEGGVRVRFVELPEASRERIEHALKIHGQR